jgi:hypothetical protein
MVKRAEWYQTVAHFALWGESWLEKENGHTYKNQKSTLKLLGSALLPTTTKRCRAP